MRLRTLNVENLRNVASAQLRIDGADTYFLGANAQGKTNLLEGIGLLTAARSFRTQNSALLVRSGTELARLYYEVEQATEGESTVLIEVAKSGRKCIEVDGERERTLADFIGRFPCITMTADDVQLIRCGPGLRRRWLDLTLASIEAAYFQPLTRYHRALKDRNRLLKARAGNAELAAFEGALARYGADVVARRAQAITEINERIQNTYTTLADTGEKPGLHYRPGPGSGSHDPEALAGALRASRPRDLALGSTTTGPHRDDLLLSVNGRPARDFGSEGQQRSLVLALRLAQWGYAADRTRQRPLLLADDVLGELDAHRREGFWRAVDPETQIIATGTAAPPEGPRQWRILRVVNGTVSM